MQLNILTKNTHKKPTDTTIPNAKNKGIKASYRRATDQLAGAKEILEQDHAHASEVAYP
jgi:hypothetical protein